MGAGIGWAGKNQGGSYFIRGLKNCWQ